MIQQNDEDSFTAGEVFKGRGVDKKMLELTTAKNWDFILERTLMALLAFRLMWPWDVFENYENVNDFWPTVRSRLFS